MKGRFGFGGLVLAISGVAGGFFAEEPLPRVRIDTALGAITVELNPIGTPATVANFPRYVDGGFYSDGEFFRTVTEDNQPEDTVKIEVIQGGANSARRADGYPPIELERTTGSALSHVDGAISMARSGPDTATDSFFICVGDQPELDFGGRRNPDGQGFAVFGAVVEGMEVVRTIHQSPATGRASTRRWRSSALSGCPEPATGGLFSAGRRGVPGIPGGDSGRHRLPGRGR